MRTCPSTQEPCYAEVCKSWPCDPAMMKALAPKPDTPASAIEPDEVVETEDGVVLSVPAEEGGRFEIEP